MSNNTALQVQHKEILKGVKQQLEQYRPTFAQFLTQEGVSQEITSVLDVVAASAQLQKCSPDSIARACYHAVSLGLTCNPKLGLAWIVPRWNSKSGKNEANFQIGWRGYVNKVLETGYVIAIEAHAVYQGEHFKYRPGTKFPIDHEPTIDGDHGELRCVYAYAVLANGYIWARVMTIQDVERHRAKSQTPNSGPWVSDYIPMCLKTVVMDLCRKLPIGTKALQNINHFIDSEESLNDKNNKVATFPVAPIIDLPAIEPVTNEAIDVEVLTGTEDCESEQLSPEYQRNALISCLLDIDLDEKENKKPKYQPLPKGYEQWDLAKLEQYVANRQKANKDWHEGK